jgi:RHS repeat-associated protein
MSTASAGPASIISLPAAGGALRGIGESFRPDPHTGTGTCTVPITVPRGRNGFQPDLSLVYSTGNGNGFFGLGWRLSGAGISRKTSQGVPRYGGADTFVLSGAEDLVLVDAAANLYRPRTEGIFARIVRHLDPAHDFWEVRSRDGLTTFYGTNPSSGPAYPAGWNVAGDMAVTTRPGPGRDVFAWQPTLTTDPYANRIEYLYLRDRPGECDQPMLGQIRYADYGTGFLVTVTFEYENRPDPFSDHRAGFEIRTSQRCRAITVRTDTDEIRQARRFTLAYSADPLNGVSLLRDVTVHGFDEQDAPVEELPPLSFGYTGFAPLRRELVPVTGPDLPPLAVGDRSCEQVDLSGGGLPDVLQLDRHTARYWRNLGGGRFDRPRDMPDAPGGLALADTGVQLVDADGDGRADLLVTHDGVAGYFPLRFGGQWDRRSFLRYTAIPSFGLEDPDVKLVDLDGDGRTDAIRSGTRMECYFNNADPGLAWRRTRSVARRSPEVFPDVTFSDPRVRWADMNGDGLQDIVLVYDRNVEYWPSQGHGDWGRRVHMTGGPRLPYGYDPARLLLGDVDGDGLADLVYVDHDRVLLWVNRSGNGWSPPVVIPGTPPVSAMQTVRLTDLLGTGVAGVLWSSTRRSFFLDLTGGVKPYLLSAMDNHLGATLAVTYRSSAGEFLRDGARRATRWRTPLPFPVQVVSSVVSTDQLSQNQLTTEYAYHQGYWDGAEREFRGFGLVEQRDAETAGPAGPYRSPPTLTRTWFHQGPVGDEAGAWADPDRSGEYWRGDPSRLDGTGAVNAFLAGLPHGRARRDALRSLRGSVLRTELFGLDGSAREDRPYTVTEHAYGLRAETPDATVFFPHVTGQRTTRWERGDDSMTTFTFTGAYDGYGQPCSQIAIAVPRGRSYADEVPAADPAPEPYLATHTVTDYAQRDDDVLYAVDRVSRTTTYEIGNDGRAALLVLRGRIEAGAQPATPVAQTVSYYDGGAFTGLPFGALGTFGALVRSESLVLTDPILQRAYGGALPGDPWPAGYPPGFVAAAPVTAGYTYYPGGAGAVHVRGYFAPTDRRSYDFHRAPAGARGMIEASLDPLGHRTDIGYDPVYDLLPTTVVDAAGLTTRAAYDYRTLRPRELTDPNGSRIRYAYTPLGLLARTWTQDRTGTEGDLAAAGVTLTYDFQAYVRAGQPISVRTVRRIHHDSETGLPQATRDLTVQAVEYSDAFGRLVQTRQQDADVRFGGTEFGGDVLPADQGDPATQAAVTGRVAAAGDPNVVVSGWQRYDNKGRVVERYEPFLSQGWGYARPAERELGQKLTMFYDPLGRIIRTERPDGAQLRTIYGIPDALDTPDDFAPTPWETYAYDANDLAPFTGDPATVPAAHHYTPASAEVDALGRTVRVTARDDLGEHVVRTTYDIRGNVVSIIDALGRTAFSYVHDLADRAVRIDALDAGTRRMVLDAAGQLIQRSDSKDAVLLRSYDALGRPVRLWARDAAAQAITLRERVVYGDDPQAGLPAAAVATASLLGRIYRHFDGAGRLTFGYDFKGNPVEQVRAVVADSAIAAALAAGASGPPQVVVDWDAPPQIEGDYQTTRTYDALNRFTSLRYPADSGGGRAMLTVTRNRAGALEGIALDGESCVDRIAYDARGRRVLVAYGNGVLTRYAYDPRTFRLARLRTERHTMPAALTYLGDGHALQDLAYGYDPIGNVVAIHDRTPGSGIPGTPLGAEALDRIFAYDPLYRLRSATGRECDDPGLPPPWRDEVRCADPAHTRGYTETYDYDAVGNMTLLRHAPAPDGYDRVFTLVPGTNRVQQVTDAGAPRVYRYDDNGNLVQESTERQLAWDFADRLCGFAGRATPAGPPEIQCAYLYGADGERVKRYSRDQLGQVSVTVAIDGLFEHRTSGPAENDTLHVMDDAGRVATVRVGGAFPGDGAPGANVRYQLGDHLGGAHVVLGGASLRDNGLVDREEYTPYGETSFGGFAGKRYRFTGKERDDEAGLYYYGARYYAPWTARWVSCDPAALAVETSQAAPRSPVSGYLYAAANPLAFVDRDGNKARSFYVTLPSDRFSAQDTGGYLTNSGTYGDQLAAKGTGYEHITTTSLADLVSQLNSKLAPGDTVKDLAIATHGSRSGTFLLPSQNIRDPQESGYQSSDTLTAAAHRLGDKLADLQKRMAGATITLHACETGNAREALKDVGRFFGAKGGEVVAPRPFVQFYKRNEDGAVILRLDADMKAGGEWLLDSKKGRESMTRVRITDDPMSTKPAPKAPDPNGRRDSTDPALHQNDKPAPGFEGYSPDNLIDPSRQPDAGRYRLE